MQDFRDNPNENFRQAYAATALEHDIDDEMEVELATPWQRMGARLLDGLPFACIGILAAILLPIVLGAGGGEAAVTAVIIIAVIAVSACWFTTSLS